MIEEIENKEPSETSGIEMHDFIRISDPNTNEVILEQRGEE